MKYLLLLAFIGSCPYLYSQSALPRGRYVILPFDKETYTSLPKNSVPATLIDSDYITIDDLLTACIYKYNRQQTAQYKKMVKRFPDYDLKLKEFTIDLKRYYRQYMVVRNEKGEKEVWVNCFCSIQYMDYWKKQVVSVDDGGNCFFNVKINLSKRTFDRFMVNGMG